ncbi:MAG TPA: hypothetical protein VMT52_15985 [Planctomycetota bacterium]|nr:hypothetical protein [Planctomycetota bacterium]
MDPDTKRSLLGRRAVALLLGAAALAVCTSLRAGPRGLVVHEWGTFLSVQGPDGVSLGGMVDSEEDLPVFVEERTNKESWVRALMRQKMETPVTYFYTDHEMTVECRVDMPHGVLTHWFPSVFKLGPGKHSDPTPSSTFLDWGPVHLIPDLAAGKSGWNPPPMREVPAGSTWRFARETDSAFVRTAKRIVSRGKHEHDHEKFLFYRGLGAFELPLEVRSEGEGSLRLDVKNRGKGTIRGILGLDVAKDGIGFSVLGDLAGGEGHVVNAPSSLWVRLPLEEGVVQVKDTLARILVAAGLYEKEARAMVNTWEKSYFRSEGLRVLYILPRETVDEVIPLQIRPAPAEVVRVMVGRVEVLTPGKVALLEAWLQDLDSASPGARETARRSIDELGRFAEPALHRVASSSRLPGVPARAEALLKKIAERS